MTYQWAPYAEIDFIEFLAEFLNAEISGIVKTVRGGRKPGTWAHWQIAMASAEYLIHEFLKSEARSQHEGGLFV